MVLPQKGTHPYTDLGRTWCVPGNATVKLVANGDGATDEVWWSVPHQAGLGSSAPIGPRVQLSVGMVTGAYTILSEGWTNNSPSAAGSAQGIRGH